MKKYIYVSVYAIFLTGIFSHALGDGVTCNELTTKIGEYSLQWKSMEDICQYTATTQNSCWALVTYNSPIVDKYAIALRQVGNPKFQYTHVVATWKDVLDEINKPGTAFQKKFIECQKNR